MSRRRPNFSTRTPEEDVARLDPNESEGAAPAGRAGLLHWPPTLWSRHQGVTSTEPAEHRRHLVQNPFHGISEWWNKKIDHGPGQEDAGVEGLSTSAGPFRDNSADRKDKHMHRSRSFEETKKLGTFSGVFVPTSLNVLSILMFLRFGFILGQAGLLGILGDSPIWNVVRSRHIWLTNRDRTTCAFISDQLGNDDVSLCDCNKWYCSGWWCILPHFSLPRPRVRWLYRSGFLLGTRLQYGHERGRSSRLFHSKLWNRVGHAGSFSSRGLLVAVSLGNRGSRSLYSHLLGGKLDLCSGQQRPFGSASHCNLQHSTLCHSDEAV